MLSQLHLASCAYEPGRNSELMLHLSKGNHWLTLHPLLLLEAPAVSLFAVILRVAGGRATTVLRLSCSAKPEVLCLQSCGACSPSLQLCCCSITMCHGPSLHGHGRRKLFLCDMHQDGALPRLLMKRCNTGSNIGANVV